MIVRRPKTKLIKRFRKVIFNVARFIEEIFLAITIGANWAVFGAVDRVLENIWSELSIVSVVVSLAIGLLGAWKLGGLLRQRVFYAEADRERWTREFDENSGKETPWPFTKEIDRWGAFLRLTKTLLPVLGGSFSCSLFF